MTHSFIKKALTFIGVAALAVPLALGMNGQKVSADGDTSTPEKQTIILTKYGFKEDTNVTAPTDTGSKWTSDTKDDALPTDAKPLQGVEFKYYDVTENYWKDPAAYKDPAQEDIEKLSTQLKEGAEGKPVEGQIFGTTGDDGTITKALPTTSTDPDGTTHAAVYLFEETTPRAGYSASPSEDFWLSLPAAADADGNVYVYPKNKQKTTYVNIFHKIDGVTGQDLPGAKFVLKDGDQYVKLTTSDGKDISEFKDDNGNVVSNTAKGFVDVLTKNYVITTVASDKDATTFISGDDGIFGLNGIEGSDKQYTAIETDAPRGF